LAGLLFDDHGERMTPSHAVKNGKRYRYYVSQSLITQSRGVAPQGRRIPAGDIEHLVAGRMRAFISSEPEVFAAIRSHVDEAAMQKRLIGQATALSRSWPDQSPAEIRGLLRAMVARIELHQDKLDIRLVPERLLEVLAGGPPGPAPASEAAPNVGSLTLSVPVRLTRAGMEIKMLIDGAGARKATPDPSLIKLIAKAQAMQGRLMCGGDTIGAIADDAGVSSSYFTRLVRLSFLAPDITKAIVEGRHPPELTARRLIGDTRLPLDWGEQRTALGFA
jgi:hypothetical protein